MTLAQVHKKLAVLEQKIDDLRQTAEYQHTVEGFRRGLAPAERGKGPPTGKVFAAIRRARGASRS